MKRTTQHAVLFVVALFAAGCASLTSPDSPQQKLAYADAQFTALVNTAADLREQGTINEDMAAELSPIIQEGDRTLTLAWAALGKNKPDTALEYLTVVNRLLNQLSQQLQEARDDRS